jgi:hypothetical protein
VSDARAVRFEAVLQVPPDVAGTFVVVPEEVAVELDARGRTSGRGAINGAAWSGQIMPYRDASPAGRHWYMVVNARARTAARATAGDRVTIELVRDDAPRHVAVPAELQTRLDVDPADRLRWSQLARSHRNEFASWVAAAKRAETRQRRAEQAIEQMRSRVPKP